MSSNFIVFPFRAVSGLFFSSLERQREKTSRNGAKGRTEAGGGWQGVRESAVRDKPHWLYGLARNRRSPKRPSEPRPSGVRLEEVEVGKKTAQPSLESGGLSLRIGSQHTAGTHEQFET
jgi:hypothetical protein